MAGLIARLFGGRQRPPDPNPLPGEGGYAMPPGPYGASGFPGSTSATRTFKGSNPRAAKVEADTNSGINNALGTAPEVRQASYRGDQPARSPRTTPQMTAPQTLARQELQDNSAAEFYGGQPLRTRPGYNLAGQNPLSGAQGAGGHDVRDTETPAVQRQPQISLNTPGAQNVRNGYAERYRAVPGQVRTYMSAPRADQGYGPSEAAAEPVQALSRFVFAGGGVQTWSAERQMPYTGRGDGARGADLNGTRYYATGAPAFVNAGMGEYGKGRLEGPNHRPTVFTEPAPWSANYYDTTASTGTPDAPGSGGQAPDLVYVSPSAGRASNGIGRTG